MIERHSSIEPVHPGDVRREDVLPALSMSKTAVADALGISRQTLYDILPADALRHPARQTLYDILNEKHHHQRRSPNSLMATAIDASSHLS